MSYSRRPPGGTEGMVSLKVDNLTYRTSLDDLKRAFGKYGEVGDVYIPRDRFTNKSRGFAFVRYYDKRDAEDALDYMDGAILDGRELRVNNAKYGRPNYRPRGRGYGGGGYGGGGGSYSGRRRSYHRSRSRSRSRSRGRRSRSRSRGRRNSGRSKSRSRSRSDSKSKSRSRSPRTHRKSRSKSRSRSRSPVTQQTDRDKTGE